MQNFQDIAFVLIQMYGEIFICALLYLQVR